MALEEIVFVLDKLLILAAMKQVWGKRLTTVFPRQGHYALDPAQVASYPPADISIGRVGELMDIDWRAVSAGAHQERRE